MCGAGGGVDLTVMTRRGLVWHIVAGLLVMTATVGASSTLSFAATPVSDGSTVPVFSFVTPLGKTTLPKLAFENAEHFTFSLLNVAAGSTGAERVKSLAPYLTPSCWAKQARILLADVTPALGTLKIVIESARQTSASSINVTFGGADTLTDYGIIALTNSVNATMAIGLERSRGEWLVNSARLLNAKHANHPACA